ncbi:Xaa-Pro dipeptidase family enzyme [alpha proteobacterium U9-1i]|nr:Xaa-Pro dipeptidase family enzyme [alpha proteobacterium U9-1i]
MVGVGRSLKLGANGRGARYFGRLMRILATLLAVCLLAAPARAQVADTAIVLRPDRVWTGSATPPQAEWAVLIADGRIAAVGPSASIAAPAGAREIALPGVTLTPGLIDLHTHLLLRAYSIESWDDQVLRDSEATRVIRGVAGARATLLSGFTTIRDLGSEGAGYADVALRNGANDGSMQGPRMYVATLAIVARGGYGPRRTAFRPDLDVPQGAQEASGVDEVVAAVRTQMAHGADWIKLYGDYRFGNSAASRPTFSQAEINAAVATAHDAGLRVSVHAVTDEAIRRAVLAGADTIEHGYGATRETFRLMARRGVAFIPTLAAADTVRRAENAGVAATFRLALSQGVAIGAGSDAGVFAHGENVRELELMVAGGMTPTQALIAATSTNARLLGQADQLGVIAVGAQADLAGFVGDPTSNITALRNVSFVMQRGAVVRAPIAAQ